MNGSLWKRRLKSGLGWLLFQSGIYRWFLRNRSVVVLFHRVDDRRKGNPISCTVGEFEAFCRFFARYFDVIGFSELLARLERDAPIGGSLVITFDDGYRDNYTAAMPVLLQYRLPATFFIATDFIGTDRIPWWDAELGIVSEWMTWDEVRALHHAGFEIGAHTCNHVDLGEVHGIEAENEILGSVERLESELETAIRLFSYPYGRKHQITEANREFVRQAGLRCCPSAFGGIVKAGDDPYHLLRQPISPWYISPWQFGFELLFAKR